MRFFHFLLSASTLICFLAFTNSAPTTSEDNAPATHRIYKATAIDGAWQLVWAKYNDTIRDVSKTPMLKMFHYGVFSLIARDSAGKISFAGFGDYELSGDNIIKKRFATIRMLLKSVPWLGRITS